MKKLLCLILSLHMFLWIFAQETESRVHIVQRGESIDRIASKYGTTVEELYRHNQFLNTHFYVGQKINIPAVISEPEQDVVNMTPTNVNVTKSSSKSTRILDDESLLRQAAHLESNRKFSKAQKIYKSILKHDSSARLYFLNGRCYYQDKKWKKAIRQLRLATIWKDCDAETEISARTLLESAQQQRKAQLQRRSQMWAVIGASVAMSTASALASTSQPRYTPTSYTSTKLPASNLDYLLDPNYAIMQVLQQEQQEYQMARQFRPELTLEEFRMEKGRAYMAVKEAERQGNMTETRTTNSTSQPSSSKASSSKSCFLCHGIGKCWTCNGKKTIHATFGSDKILDCPNCTDGLCSHCHGSGKS